eukprot:Gb_09195 [translate_table: standard]
MIAMGREIIQAACLRAFDTVQKIMRCRYRNLWIMGKGETSAIFVHGVGGGMGGVGKTQVAGSGKSNSFVMNIFGIWQSSLDVFQ